MEKKRFQLSADHRPLGICEQCLKNEKLTRGSEDLLISYCAHNKTVGILLIQDGEPRGPWRMISPLAISEVNEILEKSNSIFEAFIQKAEENELAQMPSESFYRA
jgi:hypothetical protein